VSNDPLWIIIVFLLIVGDSILAFIAGMKVGEKFIKKKKKRKDDDFGIEVMPDGPNSGSIRVPEHKLPEFFNSLVRARANLTHSVNQEEKKETPPAGYI
jgi:hypothetical protein